MSSSNLATGRGRRSAILSENRSLCACAWAMVSAVIVRQKRWVTKWMDFSTDPVPCFLALEALAINAARQDHLASFDLPI